MKFKIGKFSEQLDARRSTIAYQGKTSPAVTVQPYGVFSNPAVDTVVGIHADQGNEESLFAIPFEVDTEKLEELETGEVAFGSPEYDARLKFLEDGTMALYNATTSLMDLLEGLIDEVKAITTSGSAVAQAVDAASQASLEAYKTDIEGLLSGSQ